MKMRSLIAVGLLGFSIAAVALAKPALAADATHKFIENASIGGQFEISSSRLALQNSQNDDIKNFAQQMVDEHTQIGSQLSSVIATANPDETQPTISMDGKHQRVLDQLNNAHGKAFDRLYVREQVKAHNDAVKLFQHYASTGDSKAVREFAQQTLPTLKQHQEHANELHEAF